MLALDADDRALCLWQYRHPAGVRFVELPAGLLDGRRRGARSPSPCVSSARRPSCRPRSGRTSPRSTPRRASRPRSTTSSWPAGSRAADRGDFELEHEEADMEIGWVPFEDLYAAVRRRPPHRRAAGGLRAAGSGARPGLTVRSRRRDNGVTSEGRRLVKVGVPKEVKNHEYRVAITPDRRARAGRSRPPGLRRAGRRRRLGDQRRRSSSPPVPRSSRTPTRSGARARHGAQGQGADRRGVPPDAGGPRPSSPTSTSRPTSRSPRSC